MRDSPTKSNSQFVIAIISNSSIVRAIVYHLLQYSATSRVIYCDKDNHWIGALVNDERNVFVKKRIMAV